MASQHSPIVFRNPTFSGMHPHVYILDFTGSDKSNNNKKIFQVLNSARHHDAAISLPPPPPASDLSFPWSQMKPFLILQSVRGLSPSTLSFGLQASIHAP